MSVGKIVNAPKTSTKVSVTVTVYTPVEVPIKNCHGINEVECTNN